VLDIITLLVRTIFERQGLIIDYNPILAHDYHIYYNPSLYG